MWTENIFKSHTMRLLSCGREEGISPGSLQHCDLFMVIGRPIEASHFSWLSGGQVTL